MPMYTVFVATPETNNRIVLSEGADQQKAQDLAFALVAAAGSNDLEIGIDVKKDGAPPPDAGGGSSGAGSNPPPAAQSRPAGARQQNVGK